MAAFCLANPHSGILSSLPGYLDFSSSNFVSGGAVLSLHNSKCGGRPWSVGRPKFHQLRFEPWRRLRLFGPQQRTFTPQLIQAVASKPETDKPAEPSSRTSETSSRSVQLLSIAPLMLAFVNEAGNLPGLSPYSEAISDLLLSIAPFILAFVNEAEQLAGPAIDAANAVGMNLIEAPLAWITASITFLIYLSRPVDPKKVDFDPAVYDFESIADFARSRRLAVIGRAVRVIGSFGMFWLTLAIDSWLGLTEEKIPERAAYLRNLLTSLGPTFIKLGQSLSCRPDLVRRDYLEELTLLQDRLPSFDNKVAFEMIKEDLGKMPNQIFHEITSEPIAAASLGQVYKGKLVTGEDVAIKVQRPNLKPVLMMDLFLLHTWSPWLAKILPIQLGFELSMIVDEFGKSLFEELDYYQEADNCDRFAGFFVDDPSVKVPVIYRDYSGKRVLTLEWIDGFKANDSASVQVAGLDSNELIKIGVTCGLRQLLEYGFFHADPHPGNIFCMRDGRLAYIDFGMMASLSQEAKETLVDALVHLINEDYPAVVEDFITLGFLPRDTDVSTIVPALRLIWEDAMGESVQNFNFKSVTDRFSDLVYRYPFRVPAQFALVIRSLLVQEGISLALNPDFRILEVAYPYVATRLLTDESPRLRRRLIEVLFKDGRFQWKRLENLIGIAMIGGRLDLRPTARLALDYVLSPEGDFLRRELILALIEDDRLHTVELRRLWDLIKDQVTPEFVRDMAQVLTSKLINETLARSRIPVLSALPPFRR